VRIGFDIGSSSTSSWSPARHPDVATEHASTWQGRRDPADVSDAAISAAVQAYVEAAITKRNESSEHIGFLTHELRNPGTPHSRIAAPPKGLRRTRCDVRQAEPATGVSPTSSTSVAHGEVAAGKSNRRLT